MTFWAVVFVVLMVIWLVLGIGMPFMLLGPDGRADYRPIVGNTLLPWACVAILGWLVLGGGTWPPPPPREGRWRVELERYRRMMRGLADLIAGARQGDEDSVARLRAVCVKAAEAAPPPDLARIGQFLYDLRAEGQ